MKRRVVSVALVAVLAMGIVCWRCKKDASATKQKKAGFVTMSSVANPFFQTLAAEFEDVFKGNGWQAVAVDGEFNPTKQIELCENFIAQEYDVIVCWPVAAEAMGGVIDGCEKAGIKFVSFVNETAKYDALMVSDNTELAMDMARVAAKWIDTHFASSPDHSIPTAVFTCRFDDANNLQADVLVQIEKYSKKAKFVKEVQLTDETNLAGQEGAENLYTTNPEIKVFLTANSAPAAGIEAFFTGVSSPVKDYKDMGIFCINGDNSHAELVRKSKTDASPFRGTVLTGSARDTAEEMFYVASGLMDGSLPKGHLQKAGTVVVIAETADEFLSTGKVTSVTMANYR